MTIKQFISKIMYYYCDACSWISNENSICENCPYGVMEEVPSNVHPDSVLGRNLDKLIWCKDCETDDNE